MFVANVLDAQRALAPGKLRVRVAKLLRILALQIEEQCDNGDAPDHNGAESKRVSAVVVWRVAVDVGSDDGETLA